MKSSETSLSKFRHWLRRSVLGVLAALAVLLLVGGYIEWLVYCRMWRMERYTFSPRIDLIDYLLAQRIREVTHRPLKLSKGPDNISMVFLAQTEVGHESFEGFSPTYASYTYLPMMGLGRNGEYIANVVGTTSAKTVFVGFNSWKAKPIAYEGSHGSTYAAFLHRTPTPLDSETTELVEFRDEAIYSGAAPKIFDSEGRRMVFALRDFQAPSKQSWVELMAK